MTPLEVKLTAALRESVKSLEWAATVIGDIPPKSHYMESLQEARELIAEAEAQPEQEPVAHLCENAVGHKYFRWKKPSSTYKPIALYASPPERKPLTDAQREEIAKGWRGCNWTVGDIIDAIEAAHGIKEEA